MQSQISYYLIDQSLHDHYSRLLTLRVLLPPHPLLLPPLHLHRHHGDGAAVVDAAAAVAGAAVVGDADSEGAGGIVAAAVSVAVALAGAFAIGRGALVGAVAECFFVIYSQLIRN